MLLLDQLVKSRFIELFGDPLSNDKGWKKVVIAEVCHAIFGGGTPSKSHPEYFAGSIPWVSPKDMKSSVINDSIDHITEEAIAHSTTNLVPANSVLMVIRSGILKHSLPVAINSLPVTINQDMKAFVPNETVKTAFLMHFFKAIENDVLAGVRGVTADNVVEKATTLCYILISEAHHNKIWRFLMTNINIGNKIRELRKKKGITQEVLASVLSVSPQAVSKWESGLTYPDMEMMPVIAGYF